MKNKLHTHIPNRKTPLPQSLPLDKTQVKNNAGGYGWQTDQWQQLRRFLVIGTEGGTYYQSEGDLTRENYGALVNCLNEDGLRTVKEIAKISMDGTAVKNTPAIFALAIAASIDNQLTRAAAYNVLPMVCRTGTHLFQFAEYAEAFRGWGRGLRRAVSRWYTSKKPRDLAYQMVKYQQREGWSHTDLLRLAHPKTIDPTMNALFAWAVGKSEVVFGDGAAELAAFMDAYHMLKTATDERLAAGLIRSQKLPREVVPTPLLNSAVVWEALLDDMPMTALVRNLNKLTAVGVIAPFSAGLNRARELLNDTDAIHKSRIHPLTLLVALKQYAAGHGERGSMTWKPVAQIIDALNDAFYLAFDNLEKSDKAILLAVDVSGSMTTAVNGVPNMSAFEAGAALMMACARSHANSQMIAFDNDVTELTISPRMRLDDVLKVIKRLPHGGTDISLPVAYAQQNKLPIDGIFQITDSETWAGNRHPSQALDAINKTRPVRLVNVQTTPQFTTQYKIGTPHAMELVGFGADIPNVANLFLSGQI